MIFLIISPNLNINIIEQRLIQIFGYSISEKFLHELMFLGMNYSFKFSNILNLENIKGNFYMYNLLQYNNLNNKKLLFKYILKSNYTTLTYNSLMMFKKFYVLINKINPILNILDFIINTKIRSNKIQQHQIIGTRGFLNTSSGYITKFPLLQNFERGLNLIEYIISSYGVRKGLLDTSIQTSESGYLTRRLVEVAQDVTIKETNCGSKMFFILRKYHNIRGDLCFPNCQILFTKYFYQNINKNNFYIKSPILCYSGRSVCVGCVGFSFSIKILNGESIGVTFGELLGEPTTQSTLRTFHTGGVLNIINKNNFYIFKNNVNNILSFIYFKILSKNSIKKLLKNNIFYLFNRYKYIISHIKLKTIYNSNICFNFKILNSYINFAIINKFNIFFIKYPILNSFLRYNLKLSNKYITNILINFHSSHIIVKNNLDEWAIFLITNSISYLNLNYFILNTEGGGVFYNTFNLIKAYILSNKSCIFNYV